MLRQSWRQFGRFALVGLANTAIDMAAFSILAFTLESPLLLANTIAYALGVLNSFVCNKYWTFADVERQYATYLQLPAFVATNLIGLAIANMILMAASQAVSVMIAKLASIAGAVSWNFWASKRIVFRHAK